jgi:hypothetical protein
MEKYGTTRDHGYPYKTTQGFECWITEAKNTYTEYVLLIAFPLQQCLHGRASMLHCTYTACLVGCYAVYTGQQQRFE